MVGHLDRNSFEEDTRKYTHDVTSVLAQIIILRPKLPPSFHSLIGVPLNEIPEANLLDINIHFISLATYNIHQATIVEALVKVIFI